ncbi:hypothetical protein CHARACLAT_032627 [Characodon lateralis]|uniref:Uncharacterized protein n=1 Tax=Characodon lateralis TaxID=208331 RepID=A0ABU7ESI2_9TELE|nr:hypothetical protein [Characodon lateralis]
MPKTVSSIQSRGAGCFCSLLHYSRKCFEICEDLLSAQLIVCTLLVSLDSPRRSYNWPIACVYELRWMAVSW